MLALLVVLSAALAAAPSGGALSDLDEIYPDLEALYVDLHRHPELSLHEEKTAAKLADRLRRLGFDVTAGVGGHGLVGLLRNGAGPTVLLRTDLDGLPIEEKTGLPYASRETFTRETGETVSVMPACGHDLHMTAWIAAATLLSRNRSEWRGTVMLVGQPAEELGSGAEAMLRDGLFSRFPKPDAAFAIHDSADFPAGIVAYTAGHALASADSVDVTFFGKGGHGAYPHKTVDPIVIASRFVLAVQTLVSRERNPLDPAVVTVGSFHAGSKHNIVPDEAKLQLTVRAYKDEVRRHLLDGIARIAKAEAGAAGAPREPEVRVVESTPSTNNDPALCARLAEALRRTLGAENVVEAPPVMGAEDFSEYGRAGVPAAIFWVGAVEPSRYERAKETGEPLPGLHSPMFAPDRERSIRTAATVVTAAALELLGKPR
jgi:amidohydrolase